MKVLGFYLGGHDSNLSLVYPNGEVVYYKAERLYQHKHKHANLNWVMKVCQEIDFKPDIVCFSDGNRNGLGNCDKGNLYQKIKPIPGFLKADTYIIDHHYAHILSGWTVCEESYKYGVSIDGRGDDKIKCTIIKEYRATITGFIFFVNLVASLHQLVYDPSCQFSAHNLSYVQSGLVATIIRNAVYAISIIAIPIFLISAPTFRLSSSVCSRHALRICSCCVLASCRTHTPRFQVLRALLIIAEPLTLAQLQVQ